MALGERLPSRILVVGLMAVGKTTVGRALAQRLSRPYLDNDAMLHARTGLTLQQYATRGIEALHAAEAATFSALLLTPPPWVAAAAASIVLQPSAAGELRGAAVCTVWLRARPDTLAAHAAQGSGRPLIERDPVAAFSAMVRDRSPAFAAIADVTVDVDGRSVDDITGSIIAALES